MKKKEKKEFKKFYDSKKKRLTVSLNPKEKSLLDSMMKKDDWENVSGFVKYKLFGFTYEKKYRNAINSADEELLKKILINLISDLNDHLDYINARFSRELELLKETEAMINARAISKWVSLLKNWNDSIEQKTERLFYDYKYLLARVDVIVEKKKQDYLRSIPESVLEVYARNWNDTNSPELLEYIRRKEERSKNKEK